MATLKEWTFFQSLDDRRPHSTHIIGGKHPPRTRMTLIIYGALIQDIPQEFYEAFELPVGEKLKDFTDDEGYFHSVNKTEPNNSICGFVSARLKGSEVWMTGGVDAKEAATSWARLCATVQAETGITLPPARLLVCHELKE